MSYMEGNIKCIYSYPSYKETWSWLSGSEREAAWQVITKTGFGIVTLTWTELCEYWGFPGGSVVQNLPAMQETWVQSLGQEDLLEKEMATRSSILAWRIP